MEIVITTAGSIKNTTISKISLKEKSIVATVSVIDAVCKLM